MTEHLQHKTLNDQAYAAIKQGLISGRFAPKQVLILRNLAEVYGISTTPVREALQRLVGEGLLEMLPNRSIAVPNWDVEKFSELFRIRCELEGLAAELATPRITEAVLSALHALTDEIDCALTEGRHKDYVALNQKFHFTIYSNAGSPRLLRIIENLWGEVGAYMNELFAYGGYSPVANEEHRAMLKGLAERDAQTVRRHLVADISIAAEAMLPRIHDLANDGEIQDAQSRGC
ncbi:GntR family transcriptional regulator [Falsochrobactrum sp. TDYN1]|uniref:GntR family transcriptional regulator n=1 Tax=Falsochrobactrum tianjinense TaxID=2706015 RepID=A0A949PP52_9HYPH|nr:GntR family transcriptional regulator [Falsochrobactrum sp. TDYN1]MBV2144951.1 GntR family transcriptional regulator [Falsochrobactrum sp. TDYN1]